MSYLGPSTISMSHPLNIRGGKSWFEAPGQYWGLWSYVSVSERLQNYTKEYQEYIYFLVGFAIKIKGPSPVMLPTVPCIQKKIRHCKVILEKRLLRALPVRRRGKAFAEAAVWQWVRWTKRSLGSGREKDGKRLFELDR